MIEDDAFEEEATADKGEHETTICDKFYKFNLDSCTTLRRKHAVVLALPPEKIQKDTEQHRHDSFRGIQFF